MMDNIKQISPSLSEIKTGTPAYKIDDKIFVGGIGGNFIPGINGTDVSDTTAVASDVLSSKYFYTSAGIKTQGTITSKIAETYTPTTSNQVISAGQYLSGNQTISGDANLVAGNIKKDITIFGVTGTYSGTIINYYKCASVGSGTWTGYKAIQDSTTKEYSFEQTLTTDTLTFDSTKRTPIVNYVYTADALIQADLYTSSSSSSESSSSSSTPSTQYLTFTANQANSTLKLTQDEYIEPATSLQYRINGGGWTDYTIDEVITLINIGDYVQFNSKGTTTFSVGFSSYYYFVMSGSIAGSGNINSLINNSDLSYFCYTHMFDGCTSLTTAPELPSTTLAPYCYFYMFNGCVSLTTAPVLPSTNLVEACYLYMFNGCSSLNRVEVNFTAWNENGSTEEWLYGVSSTGTFICPSTLEIIRGISRIPNNWEVQNPSSSSSESSSSESSSSSEQPSGTTIIVSGAGTSVVNGTYTLEEDSPDILQKKWNNGNYQIKYSPDGLCWLITESSWSTSHPAYYNSNNLTGNQYPWEMSNWYSDVYGDSPVPTVTQGGGSSSSSSSSSVSDDIIISGFPGGNEKIEIQQSSSSSEQPSGDTVIVSGAGTVNANGTYTLTSGSGYSRIWTNQHGYTISYEDSALVSWNIYGDGANRYRGQDTQDPWQATEWHNMGGMWEGQQPFPTVTQGGGSSSSSSVPTGSRLIVSGAGTADANGVYTIQDSTATGYNRVWTNTSGCQIIGDLDYAVWRFEKSGMMYYSAFGGIVNPWDECTWYVEDGTSPAPTVTLG